MSCAARFVGGSQDGKLLVVDFPLREEWRFVGGGASGLEVYRRRRRVSPDGKTEDFYEVVG